MLMIYWSIILPIILLTLLVICSLLRINEQMYEENEKLKKKLDIIQNKLDSVCNEVDGIVEYYYQAYRQPPPKS